MKRFITRCLLFCVPFVVLAYGADRFVSGKLKEIRAYKEGEFSVWNDLYAGNIKAPVVVYGSSRAWMQIDPGLIEDSLQVPAYNLGINSHNFRLENFRHQLLLKYCEKPRLIIHSLGTTTLEKRADLFNADQFLPYMLFNPDMKAVIEDYKGYTPRDFYIPMLRYFGKRDALTAVLKYVINPGHNPGKRTRGFESVKDLTWHNDLEKVKKKMSSYEVKIDPVTVTAFKNYITDCKKQGIKLVLVYSPEYFEGQLFTKNRDSIMSLFKTISTTFGVPYYDYSNDSMSYRQQYFFNAEHLNKLGADLFTKKLIDTLKRSGLLEDISKRLQDK
jgi:hypothetical protein